MRRTGVFMAAAVLVFGGGAGTLEAQLGIGGWLTGRAALEQYRGDFSAVTVPIVDSTESVIAVASEWEFLLERFFAHSTRRIDVTIDGTLRQFATAGFLQRNYAPRTRSFSLRTLYTERLETGTLTLDAQVDTRGIADLPPMPLYLPPGYLAYSLDGGFSRSVSGTTGVDAHIRFEEKDYAGPSVLPELDYLDQRSFEVQAGGNRLFRGMPGTDDYSTLRVFAAYLHQRYPEQGHRRDHKVQVGSRWYLDRWETWGHSLTLDASGIFNRSNSSRVEYNAARFEATARQRVGARNRVLVKGIWSGKSYLSPQEFLVPGEEADNAAIFEGQISRILGSGISVSAGGSWTRAETNISGDYYQRVRFYVELTKILGF